MSEICAVCHKGKGPEKCEVCGFSDNGVINREFPIPEDIEYWYVAVVSPYRMKWEREKELQAGFEEERKNLTSQFAKEKREIKKHRALLQGQLDKAHKYIVKLEKQIDKEKQKTKNQETEKKVNTAKEQPVSIPPAPAGFVLVEGGTFSMGNLEGTPDGQIGENPAHIVTVTGFYMGRCPVTQREWRETMGTTLRQHMEMVRELIEERDWRMPGIFGEGDNRPMYYVSWFDAVVFANRKSLNEGLEPAYEINGTNVTQSRGANGYRLPTEAEWEYAAKGGSGSPGNFIYSGSNDIDEVAWYSGNSGGSTQDVGMKKPNALGLYDMSGNVWEWCWDWQGEYPSIPQFDPTGAPMGSSRMFRGGSWDFSASGARSECRVFFAPFFPACNLGFRLARSF